MIRFLIPFLTFSFFSQHIFSQCEVQTFSGEGTYYTYNTLGHCSFEKPYTTLYTGALNNAQYGEADYCGACAEITGPKGTLTIMLENECPECSFGDIDLEYDAFPFIAERIDGRVPITWKVVPCPVTGPVEIYFKEGSNIYFQEVQVRNHKYPITKLEVKVEDAYVETTRFEYNYFRVEANPGLGEGPLDFRITDIFGQVIEATNIPFQLTTELPGQEQFPDCGVVTSTLSHFKNSITVSPNPATHSKTTVSNPTGESYIYELCDLKGLIIQKGVIPAGSQSEIHLPSGTLFLLRLTSNSETIIRKVMGQ